MSSPDNKRDPVSVGDEVGETDSPTVMESPIADSPVLVPAAAESALMPAETLPETTSSDLLSPTASEDVAPGWAKVDDPLLPSALEEAHHPVKEHPGLFGRPQIREILCLHDIRIGEGRTLVQVQWAGWGVLHAEAMLEGQNFQRRMIFGLPGERAIDLLIPVGATLTVSVRNLWGRDHRTLEVLASEPVLPQVVVPSTPGVRGVQMPNTKLPSFPSMAISRLIPLQLRVVMRVRRPLPKIDDRLRYAIAIESRRLSNLPWLIGTAQRYQRAKLSPSYPRQLLTPSYRSLAVPDANMVPVRDRLKAWMVEVHHGEDETEGG